MTNFAWELWRKLHMSALPKITPILGKNRIVTASEILALRGEEFQVSDQVMYSRLIVEKIRKLNKSGKLNLDLVYFTGASIKNFHEITTGITGLTDKPQGASGRLRAWQKSPIHFATHGFTKPWWLIGELEPWVTKTYPSGYYFIDRTVRLQEMEQIERTDKVQKLAKKLGLQLAQAPINMVVELAFNDHLRSNGVEKLLQTTLHCSGTEHSFNLPIVTGYFEDDISIFSLDSARKDIGTLLYVKPYEGGPT